jgi:hypothetical protein
MAFVKCAIGRKPYLCEGDFATAMFPQPVPTHGGMLAEAPTFGAPDSDFILALLGGSTGAWTVKYVLS